MVANVKHDGPDAALRRHCDAQEHGLIVDKGSLYEALVLHYKWLLSGSCKIRDWNARLVSLRPNLAQRIVLAAMMDQAEAGRPARIVVLKARKVGISTLVQSLMFFLCSHYQRRIAVMIGHEGTATKKIFAIAKLMADEYPPAEAKVNKQELDFLSTKSEYYCRTAGGRAVGAGDTPSYLHLSEVARWGAAGIDTDYIATNAVSDASADSIIVYESTAVGREMFWNKYEDAHEKDSLYTPIFIPWYLDERLGTMQSPDNMVLDSEEHRLRDDALSHGIVLTDGALSWRRSKLKSLGVDLFRQEYPSTPEEAVQGTKGLILPGMRRCLIDDLPFIPRLLEKGCRVGGIDYGYYDPTVFIRAYYVDKVLYLTDIYRKYESTAEEHASYLADGHRYYIDPSAVSGMMELRKEAFEVGIGAVIVPAPRRKGQSHGFVKDELRAIRYLAENGRLKVMRGCAAQLLLECDNLAWNERTGEPDDTRTHDCCHYDTIAALRYLVMGTVGNVFRMEPGPAEIRPHDRRSSQYARSGKLGRRAALAGV